MVMALELKEITPGIKQCALAEKYVWFYTNVYQWLDLCLLNLVPLLVLAAVNIAIIVRVSEAMSERKNTTSTCGKQPKMSSPTAILLSVSFVYFLCTIPSSTAFLAKRAFLNTGSPRAMAQVTLYVRSSETLYLANHAVNFLLYCMHGSGFRKELYDLFGKKLSSSLLSKSSNSETPTVSQYVSQKPM